MFEELERLVNAAVLMFENGASIREIKGFLKRHRAEIANEMLLIVANRVGITLDELKFDTGDSFGETRFQRPRFTFDLMANSLLALFLLFRKDTTKVRKGLRSNSTVGGVKVGKKFYEKYTKVKTQKAKDEMLKRRLEDILNGAFKRKLFRRSGMFSNRYLRTEASHAGNRIKRKRAKINGKQFMYIPKTVHGHTDQCRPYEGRFWAIDSGVLLPPYHVNCKHVVHYLDELPKNQKVSSPTVARRGFVKAEEQLGV